jgi:hypothetical protein
VVGIDAFESTASAIAELAPGEPYALFALSDECPPTNPNQDQALDLENAMPPGGVTGAAHSNLDVEVEPSDYVELLTYVRDFYVGNGQTVPPQPIPPGVSPRKVQQQGDPLASIVHVSDYRPGGDIADLADGSGDYIESTPTKNPPPDGVLNNDDLRTLGAVSGDSFNDVLVYTTYRIVLTSPLDGEVTLVSEYDGAGPAIEFGGGRFDLEPWTEDPVDLLAYTTAGSPGNCAVADGMLFSGSQNSDSHWLGLVYAPNGTIRMECAGGCSDRKTFDGSIVANIVDLNDSTYDIDEGATGAGPLRARLFK